MSTTYAERKAQRQAHAAANPPRILTNDELRTQREVIVRERLDRYHPGHGCTAEDIKAHVAETHSDEAIAEHARQWHAQQKAKQDAEAAQYAADLERKKAQAATTKAHQDRLAHEKVATAEAIEEKERAEKRSRSLENQIEGLMKRQGK
jgi:hypothetical protein